jgi:putative Ca2+/H+ antiporter (TMEM165/GDT1 family)
MPSLFFAMLAAVLASIGARDQLLVAELSEKLGQRSGVLVSACFAAAVTSIIMAALGASIAELLSPPAKLMLVAFALFLGAVELAWPFRRRALFEPTQSLFAIFVAVAARQVGDGARFLVFAISAALSAPILAATGGILGSCAALAAGWALAGDLEARFPLRRLRLGIAGILLVSAIMAGLSARGIIG